MAPALPSLLQSIRATKGPNFKSDLPARTVDNATDTTRVTASPKNNEPLLNEPPPAVISSPRAVNNDVAQPPPLKKLKETTAVGPKSFYKVSLLRMQHVEERVLRYLAEIRGRAAAGCRAVTIYKQFPTQQAAFDCADKEDPSGEYLRIFSVELASTGTRRFITTSYVEFWRRYEAMIPHHRHYYEIIRQGWPCHLYLDLEYSIAANPDKNGPEAVDAVLRLLREVFAERHNLKLEDRWVLELDSSSETKFSRHLIVCMPGAAFLNTHHAGAMVEEVHKRALQRRSTDPSCAALFVKKEGSGEEEDRVCFIDTGVYTRNRAFRLYLSSKAGKTAILLPTTGRFAWMANLPQEKIFMNSLVCNVPPESRLIRCYKDGDKDDDVAAVAGERRRRRRNGNNNNNSSSLHQYGPSPYPALDTFIESVCSGPDVCEGSPGSIRSWIVLDNGAVVLYNIKGSRYCENVGRQHRSNGVFYVVDLQPGQGVWYQKCYDPDCRGYRSPATALPQSVMQECCCCCFDGDGDDGDDLWGDENEAAQWDETALNLLSE